MKRLNNFTLVLHQIREARGHETETDAKVVFIYRCTETGRQTMVFADKGEEQPFQWIPEEQMYLPEHAQELLLANSDAAMEWQQHGIKFVKTLFLL